MTLSGNVLNQNGKHMLSAKAAARRLECDPDYVGKLCRDGKLLGERINGAWFVTEQDVADYITKREAARKARSEALAQQRRQENVQYQKVAQTEVSHRGGKFFYSIPFAASIFALCAMLVFAGAPNSPYVAGDSSVEAYDQVAALAHIESPFFGTRPISLDFATGFGVAFKNAVGNFFASLFGTRGDTVAQTPTDEVPQVEKPIQTVPTQPSVSSQATSTSQTIVNNTYPVIERRIERTTTNEGVSVEVLAVILGEFKKQISTIVGQSISNAIDDIDTSGGSNGIDLSALTDANIPDTITVSNYLPLAGGTLTGALTVSGATTTLDGLAVATLDCSAFGANGKLTTDASGNVVCADDIGGSGAPGGATTQVQFNASGLFAGDSSFTFDTTNDQLSVANIVATTATTTNATSTNLYVSGTLTLDNALSVSSGGTGIATVPSYGEILVGNGSGGYTLTSTSSLGIVGSADSSAFPFTPTGYGVATSTTVGFTGGLITVGSSTINGNATTTGMFGVGSLYINNERFTDLTGSGLITAGGALTVDSGAFLSLANYFASTTPGHITALPNLSITSSQISDLNTAINTFVHGSSTIPKTYSANVFTNAQSFTGGVTANTLTLGSLNGPLQANSGVISATSSIGVVYGGTGLTTAPSYGQLLLGNALGGYTLTATSSLGFVSTSSLSAVAPLLYNSITGQFSITQAGVAQDGYLSSVDWNTFNNKVSSSSLATFSNTFKDWQITNGALTPTTTLGIVVAASSTIGAGGQGTGLTISGGATTTGNLIVQGTATSTLAGNISVAGSLAIETSGLVYQASTNRVGIGTVSPDARLHIAQTGGGGNDGLRFDRGGATANVYVNSSDNFVLERGSNTNQLILLNTGTVQVGAGQLTVSGGNLVVSGSSNNLGVGTSTPFARLSIAGNAYLGGNVTATGTLAVAGNTTLANATTTALAISTLTSTLLKTDANGNVIPAVAGVDYALAGGSSFAYPFPSNATSTTLTFGGGFLSTSSSTISALTALISTTTNATTTNLAVSGNLTFGGVTGSAWTDFCTSITGGIGLCDGVDNTGGGGGGLSTSTAISDTWIIYGTSAGDVGAESDFTYEHTLNKLTVQYASTTGFSSSYASSTNLTAGNLTLGTLTGLLKATAGVVTTAVAGTDYATPANITAAFPFTPTTAFGTAANATSTLIGFTNGIYSLASSTIGGGTEGSGLTVFGGATTTGLLHVQGAGTSTFASNILVSGDLIPGAADTYSLGSELYPWEHIFVGPGSLYVNGQKVISTNGGDDIVVSSDPNENLIFQTTGSANIELNPTGGQVQIKNTINLTAGKSITTTDLSALPVPSGVAAGNLTIAGNAITATNLNGGISLTPTGSGGTYVTTGNFGIGTTTPATTLSVSGNGYLTGGLGVGVLNTNAGTLVVSGNTTLANATTTGLAISTLTSTLLKTNANGSVVPAIAGVDYLTSGTIFSYPFPNNATSTTLTFSGGLVSVGSTTFNGNATTTGTQGVGALYINSERFTDLTGSGLTISSNALTVDNVTAAMLNAEDFGDFTCNGTNCSVDPGAITAAMIANADHGDFTYSGGVASLDADVVSDAEIDYATVTLADFTNDAGFQTFAWPFTATAYGVSTSTTVGFTSGILSTASSTFSGGLNFGLATGTAATTTNLAITSVTSALLKTLANGAVVPAVAGTDYLTSAFVFAYPFIGNATSTTLTFSGGLLSLASTTIGGGAQNSGLTVAGGATTTGYLTVQGNSTSTFAAGIQAAALNINGGATSTFANGISISGGCFAVNGTCFGSGAGNAGGANGQVQYNASGILAGTAGFTFDPSLVRLTVTNASTTALTVAGTASTTNLNISSISNALLSTQNGGIVGATTISSPLVFSGNTLSINQAGAGSNGYLSSTDWNLFNNKISSTSLSGSGVISYNSSTGIISTTGGTFGAGDYMFPGGLTITGNSTTTNATTTNLYVSGSIRGGGLTSCSGAVDKLLWNSSTGQFGCGTDIGAGGSSEINWTYFNNTGIRVSTSTNQVLIGHTSTSSLSKLEVVGGATFDNATTTGFYSSGISSFGGSVGIGTTSPMTKLAIAGGNILQTASGNPTLATSTFTTGQTYGTYVVGRYAYIAANGGGLRILDVTNPNRPVSMGSYGLTAAQAVVVSGRYAYVSDGSTGLNIIDVSNPTSPTLVSETADGGSANTLVLSGTYLYVPDVNTGTVKIIDISNPASPTVVSSTSTGGGTPYAIAIAGKYLYVVDQGDGTLYIFDVTNPAVPVQVDTLAGFTIPTGLAVAGDYIYVADISDGLIIVNASNPTNLSIAGTYTTSVYFSVAIAGNYAYLADPSGNMEVVDIINPTQPSAIGTVSVGNTPRGIFVAGKYAYVANGSNTLSVVDINGAQFPAAHIGALQSTIADISDTLNVGGDIYAGGGLNVGISGIFSRGGLSVYGTTTLRALTATNATTTNATSTAFFATTASSTNLFSSLAQFGRATTTSFGITGVTNTLLKTTSAGGVVAAVAGVDYAAPTSLFAYPFIGNATSTTLTFSGGLLSLASTTIGDGTAAGGLTVNGTATTTGTTTLASLGGKVGIGTSSPSHTLSIYSNVSGSGLVSIQNASASGYSSIDFRDNSGTAQLTFGYGNPSVAFAPVNDLVYLNATGGKAISFLVSGSEKMRIGTTGNIGIGTTSPFARLSVAGDSYLGGNVTATGTLSVSGLSTLGNVSAANATTTALAITTLTSTLLKTDSSGNVIPAAAGTDYATPANITAAFPFTPTTNFGAAANSTSTALLLTNGLQASSTVRFGNAGGTQFVFNGSSGRLGLGTSTPGALFSVADPDDNTPALIIDSTHVVAVGDTEPWVRFLQNGSTALEIQDYSNSGTHEAQLYASGSNPTGNALRFANANGALRILPHNSDTLFLQATQANLEFSSNNGGQGTNATFDYADADFTGSANFSGNVTLNGTAANIILGSNFLSGDGGDEGVFVSSAGNVGIGTTSPFSRLSVQGALYASGNITGANLTATGTLAVTGNTTLTGTLTAGNATTTALAISTLTSTLLKTDANGNVIPAVAGTDYASPSSIFAYPFPSNATSTTLTFNSGIVSVGSTTVNGNLIVSGNSTTTNATTSQLAITGVSSSILKTNSTGGVVPAVAGTDYATPSQVTSAYPFQGAGNSTSTLTQFNGGLTSYASTTIGGGTALTGLTVSGSATTTGNSTLLGTLIFPNTAGTNNVSISTPDGFAMEFKQNGSTKATLNNGGNLNLTSISMNGDTYLSRSAAGVFQIGSGGTNSAGTLIASNVGIGTSSPFAKLSVAGDAYVGGNLTATGTLSVAGNTTLANATTTALAITTLSSTLLKTDASGNVIPAVAGTDYASPSSIFAYPFPSNATSTTLTFNSGIVSVGSTTINGNATTTGTLQVAGNTSIGTTTSIARLSVQSTGTSDILNLFETSGSKVFTVLESGNVGIGTSSPASGLSIVTTSPTKLLSFQRSDATAFWNFDQAQSTLGLANLNALNLFNSGSAAADFGIRGATSGTAQFMLQGSTGNVGVGTTSPFAKLSVAGDSYLGGNVTATGTLSVAGNTTLSGSLSAQNATTTALAITTLTSTLLKTDSSGNVIPAVAGTDYAAASSIFAYPFPSNATSTALSFTGGLTSYASTTIGGGSTTTGLTINGGATTTGQFTFLNGSGQGYELIATESSGAPHLSLSRTDNTGTVFIDTPTGIAFSGSVVTGGNVLIGSNTGVFGNGTGNLTVGAGTGTAYLRFMTGGTSGTERARFVSTGEFGIGTTTPFEKLSVAGSAYIGGNVTATGTLAVSGNTSLANATTTALAITSLTSTLLKTDASGNVIPAVAGTDYAAASSIFAYPFPSNATSTTLTFNNGLLSLASTTIGGGSTTTGLTIFGGATTTGGAYFGNGITATGTLTVTGAGTHTIDRITFSRSGSNNVITSTSGGYLVLDGGSNKVQLATGDALEVTSVGLQTSLSNLILNAGEADSSPTRSIIFQSDGSELGRFTNTGNLGIGTTTPFEKLSVAGSAYIGGNLTATGTLSVAGNTTLTNATTTALAISTLTSTLLKTDASGNVIPAVAGVDYATAGSGAYPFSLAGNATSTLTQFNGGLTAYASSTIGSGTGLGGLTINGYSTTTGNAYFAGNVGIKTSTSTVSLHVVGNENDGSTGVVRFTSGSQTMTIDGNEIDSNSSAGLALNFNSTNDVTIAGGGNLGIGATTPTTDIHIQRTGDASLMLEADTDDSGGEDHNPYIHFTQDNQSVQYLAGITGSAGNSPLAVAYTGTISNAFLLGGTNSSSAIQLGSNDVVRLTVAASGNVGIGTSSPMARFSVAGDSYLGGNVTATGTLAVTGNTTLTGTLTSGNATTTALAISTLTSTLLKTNSNGSVVPAIAGTDYASPSSIFAYPFPSNATSTALSFTGGLTSYASTTIGGGTAITGLTISGGATTTGNAYIAGTVGIGGQPTSAKLRIEGTNFASPYISIRDNGTAGNSFIHVSANNYGTVFDVQNDGDVLLSPSLGKVGIGTSTPFAKLSVAGDAYLGGNVTATGTLAVAGNTTLSGTLTAGNATTSALAITTLTSTLLKTNSNGSVVPAIAGTDYASPSSIFAYPFPSNATSTTLTFSGGLLSLASTTVGDGSAAGGLTINGNATTTGSIYVSNGSGAAPTYSFTSDPDTGIYGNGGDALLFSAGGTGRMALTVASFRPLTNDGIGLGAATVSWSDLFLASGGVINWNNGNVTLTQSNNALTLSSGDSLILDYASTTVLSANTLCISTDCRTSWPSASAFPFTPTSFGATAANSTSTLIGFTNGIYSLASSTIGDGTALGGLTISGGATTTGNAYVGGSLSIATSSAEGVLTIQDRFGSTPIGGYARFFDSGQDYDLEFDGGTDGNFWFSNTASTTNNNTGTSFTYQQTPLLTILNSGNVGVGTTTANTKFTVSGGHIFANSVSNDAGVYITGNDGAYGLVQAANNANTGTTNLVLQKYGGNVGIGTSSPTAALTVQGPSHDSSFTAGTLILAQANADYKMFLDGNDIDTPGSGLYLNDYSGNKVIVGGAYTRLIVTADGLGGYVGIGTTSPFTKLSVAGSAYLGGNLTATGTVTFTGLNAANCDVKADTNGVLSCGTDSTGSATFPFTSTTNFGAVANSTSTPLWLQAGLQASSTSYLSNVDMYGKLHFASTTTTGDGILATIHDDTLGRVNFISSTSTNLGVGKFSLSLSNGDEIGNTAFGYAALSVSVSGSNNTAFGKNALVGEVAGDYNIGIGVTQSGTMNGSENVGIGRDVFLNTTGGSFNVGIGGSNFSGGSTAGSNNVAVGHSALSSGFGDLTGSNNTAVGYRALLNATSGGENTGIGSNVFADDVTGSFNTGVGASVFADAVTGEQNTALGNSVFGGAVSGSYNIGIGGNVFAGTVTGSRNIGLGLNTLGASLSGSDNIAVGDLALSVVSSGTHNVALGAKSGYSITTGYSNILLGGNSATNPNTITTGDGNVGIGNDIFFPSVTANNQLNVGNLLFGTLPATTTAYSIPTTGNLGVATTTSALFGLHANNGATYKNLFEIGSSTASATSSIFTVSNNGDVNVTGNFFPSLTVSETLTGSLNGAQLIASRGDQANGYASVIFQEAGTEEWQIGTRAGDDNLYFRGAGTNHVAINSSGNVGIGTTTPVANLTVIGKDTGSGPSFSLRQPSSFSHLGYDFDLDTTSANPSLAVYARNTAGSTRSLGWSINRATGFMGVGTTTAYSRLSVWGTNTTAGTRAFEVVNSASTTLFTVDNAGTSSTTALRVSSLGPTAGLCLTADSSGLITTQSCGGSSFAFPFTPTSAFGTAANATSTLIGFTAGLYSTASSTIGDGTALGGLTISGNATTTGNTYIAGTVGIGTSTPNTKLTVSGGHIFANSISNDAGVYITGNDGAYGLIQAANNANTGTTNLVLQKYGGNVGIGTTSPWAKLSVAASASLGTSSSLFSVSSSTVLRGGDHVAVNGFGTTLLRGAAIDPRYLASEVESTIMDGAMGLDIQGEYAYVVGNSGDSLSIIDISDPTDPVRIASLSDSARLNNGDDVVVSGKYAYVSAENASSVGHIAVVSIADPLNPTIVATYIPTGMGSNPFQGINDLEVAGNYLYVTSGSNSAFSIIDISNPTKPQLLSQFRSTTFISGADRFHVHNNYAYIPSNSNNSLTVLDVSNPHQPVVVSQLVDAVTLSNPTDVYVEGNYAYVTNGSTDTFIVIDVSNPNSMSIIAQVTNTTNLDGASVVTVSGNYAYISNALAARYSVAVVDISNPTQPFYVAEVRGPVPNTTLSLPDEIVLVGNYLYVSLRGADGIAVIDVGGAQISNFAAGTGLISNLAVKNLADIYGSVRIGESLNVGQNALVSGALSITGVSSSTVSANSVAALTIGRGNVLIGTSTPTTTPFAKLAIHAQNGETNPFLLAIGSSTASATSTLFSVSNAGLTQAMNLVAAASSTIGDGTTAGGLTISGGATTTGGLVLTGTNNLLQVGNGSVGQNGYAGFNSDRAFFGYDGVSANAVVQGGTAKGIEFNVASGAFGAGTAAVITQAGNFGIGTTSPLAKLSVAGAAYIGGNLTATGTITFSALNSANCDVKADTNGVLSCGTDATGAGGGTFPFTTTTFGATTANATSTLIGFTNGIYSLASSTIGDGTQAGGLTISGGATTTGDMYIGDDLFVGGSNPGGDQLTVQGNVRTEGNGYFYASNTGIAQLVLNSSGNWGAIQNDSADTWSLSYKTSNDNTLGTPVLTWNNNGNVGIGTTSPFTKLSVAGSAYIGGNATTTGNAYIAGDVGIGIQPVDGWDLSLDGYMRLSNGYYYNHEQGQIQMLLNAVGTYYGTIQNDTTGTWSLGYSSNSGDSIQNSALTWTSAGKVGIGSTSPIAKLSVFASSTETVASMFAVGSSSAAGTNTFFEVLSNGDFDIDGGGLHYDFYEGQLSIGSTTAGDWQGEELNISNGWTGSSDTMIGFTNDNFSHGYKVGMTDLGNFAITNTSGSTDRLTINSSGSVGIGTSTPDSKLHVAGTGNVTLTINSTNDNDPTLLFNSSAFGTDGSGDWAIYTDGDDGDKLKFRNEDGTSYDALTLTQAGLVGFGTTSPYAQVSINTLPGATGSLRTLFAIASSTASATTTLLSVNNTGTLNLNPQDSNKTLLSYTAVDGTITPLLSLQGTGNNLQLDSGGATPITGASNVGVGIAVLGLSSGALTGTDNVAFGVSALDSLTSGKGNVAVGVNTLSDNTTGSNNVSIGYQTMSNITAAAGNVAIGSFAGNQLSTGSNNSGNIFIGDNAGAVDSARNSIFIGGYTFGTSTNFVAHNFLNIGNLLFGTLPATSTRLTLPTTGKLGVGSSTPYATFGIHANNGSTDKTLFAIGSSTASATTTLFSVLNNGNVGIGTSNSTAPLTVAWSGNGGSLILDRTDVSGEFNISQGGSGTPWVFETDSARDIVFEPDGTERLRIAANGRTGVGTTTPTALLGVQKAYGSTASTLFAVASSTASDGSTASTLFSVDSTGLTTIGDSSSTGDAVFQLANDTNAWSMGYRSSDKTFRIASSTNLTANVLFQIGKSGTTTLSSGLGTGTGGNYLCINTSTFEILRGNGSACTASSGRYKENVADLAYGLDDVMKLRAVSFTYKPEMNSGTSTHLGFIAEEVEQIVPELVTYNNDGSVQGLDYPTVTAVLTKGMQELYGEVRTVASTTINFGTTTTSLVAANNSLSSQLSITNAGLAVTQADLAALQAQIASTTASDVAVSETVASLQTAVSEAEVEIEGFGEGIEISGTEWQLAAASSSPVFSIEISDASTTLTFGGDIVADTLTVSTSTTQVLCIGETCFDSALAASLATTSATSTPEAILAGSYASSTETFVGRFTGFFDTLVDFAQVGIKELGVAVRATVGVFDNIFAANITAENIVAEKLCLTDTTGETCVTKTELDALLAGVGASATADEGGEAPTLAPEGADEPEATSTPSVPEVESESAASSTPSGAEEEEPAVEEAAPEQVVTEETEEAGEPAGETVSESEPESEPISAAETEPSV